jgi:hypothetical protein
MPILKREKRELYLGPRLRVHLPHCLRGHCSWCDWRSHNGRVLSLKVSSESDVLRTVRRGFGSSFLFLGDRRVVVGKFGGQVYRKGGLKSFLVSVSAVQTNDETSLSEPDLSLQNYHTSIWITRMNVISYFD